MRKAEDWKVIKQVGMIRTDISYLESKDEPLYKQVQLKIEMLESLGLIDSKELKKLRIELNKKVR